MLGHAIYAYQLGNDMQSKEYRLTISKMIRNSLKKRYPSLQNKILTEVSIEIARAIHARFYGADVDGVASPIWRDDIGYPDLQAMQPTKTAQDLLNE